MDEQEEYLLYLSEALGSLRRAYKATERLWLWRGATPTARKIRKIHRQLTKAHKHLLDSVRNEPGIPG